MRDLKWRFEYKYRISRLTAEALEKAALTLGFFPDPYAVQGEYPVSTIYFDSPGLYDYYDKLGGFLKRKKVRVRIYTKWQEDQPRDFWLEVKWRKNLLTAKDRVRLNPEEWGVLQRGEYARLLALPGGDGREVLNDIGGVLIGGSMKPALLVHYMRRPLLIDRSELVRMNFDHSVVACETSDFCYTPFTAQVLPEEHVIFEMKFSKVVPRWFPDLVRAFDLDRVSYSKYAEALDAVRSLRPLPR